MIEASFLEHLRAALEGQGRREYYERLVAALQSSISEKLLLPGDLLPGERELSAELNVSRNVIRRAISTLESDGILSTRHGHGTFVPRELRKSTNSILGFTEEMIRRGLEVSNRMLRVTKRPAIGIEIIDMGMSPGEEVLELVRLRLADDTVIAHELCLTPIWGVSPGYDGQTSLYSEMEQNGTRPIRVLQEISAAAASDEVAQGLAIEPGAPVLQITRKGYDKTNSVVEFTASHFRSDRYTWITELQK